MSSQNGYDVIVIGAGLGGLTAGALLAKAGKKILMVEKEAWVGGYFGPVAHGSYYFNNGPRLLMGCNADGPYGPGIVHQLLESLGVSGKCDFIAVQPFTTVRMPDWEFKLWSGREAFVEGLESTGKGRFTRLPELLELCGRIHQASLAYYAAKRPWGLARHASSLTEALVYQNSTMEGVLQRYLPQERLRNVVGALWPFLGLPPWRVSFIYWAILMASYIDEGAFFCKGGLSQLSLAVAEAFVRDGGKLLESSAVERIIVQDRRVQGVTLTDGKQFFAPVVVAGIDPLQVFGKMIEKEQRPLRYLDKLGGMELAIRGLNLSVVTDLDLKKMGFGYETLLMDGLDARHSWEDLEAGIPSVFGLTWLDAADPGMAPPGEHLINLFCSLPQEYDRSPSSLHRTAGGSFDGGRAPAPGLKRSPGT